MTVLRFVVPVAILAYYLWLARGNRFIICGLPLVVALGRSAFLDLLPTTAVFSLAGKSLTSQDLVFASLGVGWLLARRWRSECGRPEIHGWWVFGGLLAFFLGVEVLLGLVTAGAFSPMAVIDTREWFYIPLGFMLMLDMFRRLTAQDMLQIIGAVSRVTVVLTILYIAEALGADVYPYEAYQTVTFRGATIIRDFTTLSIWMGLALAYWISRPRLTWEVGASLIVLTAGCFFSYTRSLMLVALLMVVTGLLVSIWKRGDLRRAASIAATGTVLLVLVALVLPVVVPAQYAFFASRWRDVGSSGSPAQVTNLGLRLDAFGRSRQAGAAVDPLMGIGLITPDSSTTLSTSYDSDWITIVYRFGLVGLIVFGIPLVAALILAARSLPRRSGQLENGLSLLLLLFVIWTILTRFVTIVYIWWLPLGLLAVALVATDSGDRWYVLESPESEGT